MNPSNSPRKIVVIGGSGLIGRKAIPHLQAAGHEVVSASRSTGVNILTGEGLPAALAGAHTLLDVSNSPSFADDEVMEFFKASTGHLIAAAQAAGVAHFVAVSVVGTERMQASGYFRAKLVQEKLIEQSLLPYTIIRATQFFEFVGAIAQSTLAGDTYRVSPALMQPMAADDVAAAVAAITLEPPRRGVVEIAGPEAIPMDELVRTVLLAQNDQRPVQADPAATYFGTPVDDRSLTPGPGARLGTVRFGDWLARVDGAGRNA